MTYNITSTLFFTIKIFPTQYKENLCGSTKTLFTGNSFVHLFLYLHEHLMLFLLGRRCIFMPFYAKKQEIIKEWNKFIVALEVELRTHKFHLS